MKQKIILSIAILSLLSLAVFVSAGKDIIFTNGPNCDGETISFEIKYIGNSSVYASNLAVGDVEKKEGGDYVRGIHGTWSKTFLEEDDKSTFSSFSIDKEYYKINERYILYIDSNQVDGVWSDEIGFYCLNDDLHKVYECVDGKWLNTGKEAYCRDTNNNLYVSIGGSAHCQPPTYSSVTNGVWCYNEVPEEVIVVGEEEEEKPQIQNMGDKEESNPLVGYIIIAVAIIFGFIILAKVLGKKK